MTAPNLEAVLAAFRPGRVVRLEISQEQRNELRDKEGRIALDVLRHLLGARAAVGAPERFPLTERAIQALARKLGHEVGQKRCRSLRRRLVAAGVLPASGHYRQPYGTPKSARASACPSSRSCTGRLPPTQASILSASARPSSPRRCFAGGGARSSGTTRDSRHHI